MQPPGSPAAAVTQVLYGSGAGFWLLLLVFEGPVLSTADGWERCPHFPKVQSCRSSCGPSAAFPSLHPGSAPGETRLCAWAAFNPTGREMVHPCLPLTSLSPPAIAPSSLSNCSPWTGTCYQSGRGVPAAARLASKVLPFRSLTGLIGFLLLP